MGRPTLFLIFDTTLQIWYIWLFLLIKITQRRSVAIKNKEKQSIFGLKSLKSINHFESNNQKVRCHINPNH